jgi:hypothetical protein
MSTDAMQAELAAPRQASRGPRAHTHARAEVLRMLKEDHRIVKIAFREFERLDAQAESEVCESIIRQTCMELEVHTRLEEELFYPTMRGALAHAELIDDAEVEHQTMFMLLDQVRKLRPGDARQAATFRVLGEYVRHHIKEEEGEMFRQISHARLDWVRLHEDMLARRHQLLAEVDEPLHITMLERGESIGLQPSFDAPYVRMGHHP